LETDDFLKCCSLPHDSNNAFKNPYRCSSVKKLKFSSSVDVKPSNISFSDINAIIIARRDVGRTRYYARHAVPAYVAKLNFDVWGAALSY